MFIDQRKNPAGISVSPGMTNEVKALTERQKEARIDNGPKTEIYSPHQTTRPLRRKLGAGPYLAYLPV